MTLPVPVATMFVPLVVIEERGVPFIINLILNVMKNQRNRNHNRIFANPTRMIGESIVQNDLSVTPTMMMQMMEQGIPISAQNLNPDLFYDGDDNPSFELPIDMQRGVDIADCWEASTDIRKRARKGLLNDKKIFGNNPQKSE